LPPKGGRQIRVALHLTDERLHEPATLTLERGAPFAGQRSDVVSQPPHLGRRGVALHGREHADDEVLFALLPPIERGRRDAGPLRHPGHGEALISLLEEEVNGGLLDGLVGLAAARPTTDGGGGGVGHVHIQATGTSSVSSIGSGSTTSSSAAGT